MKSKLILSSLLIFSSVAANAQSITVNYTGSVTSIGSLLQGDGISVGTNMSGSFVYDTLATGSNILSSFVISIGSGFTATMTGTGAFNVQNDQQNGSATLPADGLTAYAGSTSSSSLNGHSDPSMQFGLRKENILGQLWNDVLPPDLADWAGISLADIQAPGWHWMDFGLAATANFGDDQIRWEVGAFDVSVSAVPVPAAAFMFAPALLGFLGLRRKAKNTLA